MVREKATESGSIVSNNFALKAAFLVYSAPLVIHCKRTLESWCKGNIPFPAGLSRITLGNM